MKRVNARQFDLLAGLLRSHGSSREGCRLVLVEGLRQCDAARRLAISPTVIAVALKNYRRILGAIRAEFFLTQSENSSGL